MRIFIKGLLPNLNDYVNECRNNKYKAAAVKKSVEKKIMLDIRSQTRDRLNGRYALTFVWHEKNKMRDPDNIAFAKKFVLDAMVGCDLFPNDGWNQIAKLADEFVVDKANVGVEVYIDEVKEVL